MKSLGVGYFQPRKVKDRLQVARKFLDLGKQEIEYGRANADPIRIREGAEKVFHALSEACAARIQKYGLPAPNSHDDVRSGLQSAHEKEIKTTYENAFLHLHSASYYKGWLDMEKIDEQLKEIEKAISKIEKKIGR